MTNRHEKEIRNVEIPVNVLSRVERRVELTDFDSASEYITYVLEEIMTKVEEDTGTPDLTNVDQEKVYDRLKSLGYLNE